MGVLPGGVGTAPTQQGKETHPPLYPRPLFSGQPGFSSLLEAGLAQSSQGGTSLHQGWAALGLGNCTVRIPPQSTVRGTPSILRLPSRAYVSLWKWLKDHTQWVRPSRVPCDPGNKGALSYQLRSNLITATFPAPVTCSKSRPLCASTASSPNWNSNSPSFLLP